MRQWSVFTFILNDARKSFVCDSERSPDKHIEHGVHVIYCCLQNVFADKPASVIDLRLN